MKVFDFHSMDGHAARLEFLCGNPGAKIYAGNAVIPAYYSDEIREIYKEALSGKNANVFSRSLISA